MVIKLSDYILEQSISSASIDDIGLEQLVAEMDVCCKLAMAYNKQLLMESYFQEMDGNNTSKPEQQTPAAPTTPAVVSASAPTQPNEQQPQTTQQNSTNNLPNSIARVHGYDENKNAENNNINKEEGFFKSIAGYIKRFFKWIGSKLTGISEDAIKNIKFIERYVLNASEKQIVQFIRDNKVNIEWYNPEKLSEFVNTLQTATNDLLKAFDKSDPVFANLDKRLAYTEEATTKFAEIIQSSGWVKPDHLVDEVNDIQKFKTYITGYIELFEKKDPSENLVKQLGVCSKNINNINAGLEGWFNKLQNGELKKDPENIEKQKITYVRLQKIVQSASGQINNVTVAYSNLKKFAVEINEQLKVNNNADMKRGQIETLMTRPQA